MFGKVLPVFIIAASIFAAHVSAEEPEVKAESAILAISDGEQILFDKNPRQRAYPLGLTKLMTALVAYRQCGTDESVTVPEDLADYVSPYDPLMGLRPGESLPAEALISAIVVGNANDAAIVLALRCGGTVENFVGMMNGSAEELGMSDTRFANPTGIHHEEQYTTASDLLLLYKHIAGIPMMNKIIKKTNVTIAATNKSPQRTLWTANSLTSKYYSTNYYYPHAVGGKAAASAVDLPTPYGNSVISGAVKNNAGLIGIALNSRSEGGVNYAFEDVKKLFEYGFQNFTQKTLIRQDAIAREVPVKNAGGTDRVLLLAGNTLKCFLLDGDSADNVHSETLLPDAVFAPLRKGEPVGEVRYTYRGKPVGTVTLTAGDTLEAHPLKAALGGIIWFLSLKYVKLPLLVLFCAAAVYAAIVFRVVLKAKKKKRRKRK
ncbi:MAG: hypothetical protein LBH54_05750 [Clostridiales bacterium]|jgi:D-alanyl-D-alanine carboxypeptidase (penicillin-binding protein 5/6)|nr:hypothetical protein [Clostridiales bacterium]